MEQVKFIRKMAAIDHLTDLYSQDYFYKTTEKLYASAIRSRSEIVFAIIDTDKFKIINDVYEHGVGDKALQHVTAIINS